MVAKLCIVPLPEKTPKLQKLNQTLESDRQLNSFRISQVYVKVNYEKDRVTHLS